MSTDLVVPEGGLPDLVSSRQALERVHELRDLLPTLDVSELSRAIIWTDAVSAAGRIRHALALAQEAAETRVRAERQLGTILSRSSGFEGGKPPELDAAKFPSYLKLAAIPDTHFETSVVLLKENESQLDLSVVLRTAAQVSLEEVEPGIEKAWDGSFYFQNGQRLKKAKATDLEGVRAERDSAIRLLQAPARSKLAGSLDVAYANARRDAQAASQLAAGTHGKVRELIGKAESHHILAAEALYKAYTIESSQRK